VSAPGRPAPRALTSMEDLVEATFAREGDAYAEPPKIDQPTAAGGITLGSLQRARKDPSLTVRDLRRLTLPEARVIVRWLLEEIGWTYRINQIADEPLRLQVIDFAYNSGPGTAIRWLQRCLRLAEIDGIIGPKTRAAIAQADPWLLHHALIAARFQHIDEWTDASRTAKQWEEGVESRALSFSRLRNPPART
jgi:lysozyme family protein